MSVVDGQLEDLSVVVTSDSLLHRCHLPRKRSPTKGLFGQYAQYIVSIGLMLFAFPERLLGPTMGIAQRLAAPRPPTYIYSTQGALLRDLCQPLAATGANRSRFRASACASCHARMQSRYASNFSWH